jgi:peptidoglycan DL-endopeptidase LytE
LKKSTLRLVVACAAMIVAAGWSSHAYASPEDSDVKVQINDELVDSGSVFPYIDAEGALQVPLRPVVEKLGFQVKGTVEEGKATVQIAREDDSGDNSFIVLHTGDSTALVNGIPSQMRSAPQFHDGVAYAPIRFLAESFGYILQWDEDNGIAIIGADGEYHAPAWYAPRIEPVVETAYRYLGVPYVWGGTTPNGFDCSGFVQYVFRLNGKELPRTARQMYQQVGSPTSEPEVGDLVFFARGKDFHVGIYLGDRQFISATSSHGIRVDQLTSAYWGGRYIGAKKIL